MSRTNAVAFEYQSVESLKGVGPAVAARLRRIGIEIVQDLLFHLPLRYEDRSTVAPIGSLQHGQRAAFEGVIDHSEVKFRGGRSGRSLLLHVSDGTGSITLRFFHFNRAQQQQLVAGTRLRGFGEVRVYGVQREMVHPEYRRVFDSGEPAPAQPAEARLTPVYPSTEGVHQTQIRKLIEQALNRVEARQLEELLPPEIVARNHLMQLGEAVLLLHRPPVDAGAFDDGDHPARRRMIFEELLAHHLSLLQIRQRVRRMHAPALTIGADAEQAFRASLGFELTAAQRRVIADIHADLGQPLPMMRLLQGDVGSGKTVVAAAAVLAARAAGKQAALMAPTEILAEQLFTNFRRWFGDAACLFLSGRDKGAARARKLEAIAGGAGIVIGTHALFQEDVVFDDLALVVIDEQHRFGVHQRLALKNKGRNGTDTVPHQLIMTATPIPRSLAMTAYVDLDYSVIDELPKGRHPVTTVAIPEQRREEVLERVTKACEAGERAYWVCTLVEESEALQCQAAEATAQKLQQALPHLHIGLVHGRMKTAQKNAAIDHFRSGDIDLLVATTVIEVGVDVPTASLMIIENAERLGLAQLHQLRGRVGRGSRKSSCVLLYSTPLSQRGRQRLAILREHDSGFDIARKDLEMRGPGEVLGTRQTGIVDMRIADIVRDRAWLPEIKRSAMLLLEQHPGCVKPIIRRWLGRAERYGSV